MFVIFSSDMVEILDKDRTDEEALSYALDTLTNICSPEEFEEEIVDSRPVQGDIQWLRGHNFGLFWPPTHLFVDFCNLGRAQKYKNFVHPTHLFLST